MKAEDLESMSNEEIRAINITAMVKRKLATTELYHEEAIGKKNVTLSNTHHNPFQTASFVCKECHLLNIAIQQKVLVYMPPDFQV